MAHHTALSLIEHYSIPVYAPEQLELKLLLSSGKFKLCNILFIEKYILLEPTFK